MFFKGIFLSKALGEAKIKFYGGEADDDQTLISILPTFAVDSMSGENIDVIINENSLPEMSEQSVENYMRFARNNGSGIFFSYNHEAYAPVNGIPQILVPEIVDRVGGFKRLSRSKSWVRGSYVEEVYKILD